jgi:hypothetical protein
MLDRPPELLTAETPAALETPRLGGGKLWLVLTLELWLRAYDL